MKWEEARLRYGLPFCSIKLVYKGKEMIFEDVLLDTGSGGTVFKMDKVEEIGIRMRGIIWKMGI